ncbi:hypothetical protein Cgig2_026815 [Carnegiea gigantea]|uniref:Reverse transcriptase domain-containing protein n=1 Tax=Carnegiea gigantea TaxID=171969 RepID=A0A9Q1QA99_9CARY|nr:hypothetical protein Cgig2_026815 [Carnegiea gigantea]
MARDLRPYFKSYMTRVLINQPLKKMMWWIIYTDVSFTQNGSRSGPIIISPNGKKHEYAMRFEFSATDNECDYEAVIIELQLARICTLIIELYRGGFTRQLLKGIDKRKVYYIRAKIHKGNYGMHVIGRMMISLGPFIWPPAKGNSYFELLIASEHGLALSLFP